MVPRSRPSVKAFQLHVLPRRLQAIMQLLCLVLSPTDYQLDGLPPPCLAMEELLVVGSPHQTAEWRRFGSRFAQALTL